MKNREFALPKSGVILAADPGLANFGLALIEYSGKRIKIVGTGMLKDPIRNMVYPASIKDVVKFTKEWQKLLDQYNPNVVVIERFLVRGFGTKNIELIGFMLGIVQSLCAERKIQFRPLVASQWKNNMSKHFGKEVLKELYTKIGGTQLPKDKRVPPHRADAAMMGVYVGLGNDFSSFAPTKKYLKQICTNLHVR